VLDGPKAIQVMIGGNWVGRERVGDYTLISCESPIATKLLGKKVGDVIELPAGISTVHAVEH
jgi:transcription elongation GreA/GreB family factor